MKKIILVLFLTSLAFHAAFSQETKLHFRSVNTAGASIGASIPKMLYQTINGFTYKDWFAGVGVGLDEYEIKSLPLFADIRWDFGKKKEGFIYGDLGYNFFLEDKEKGEPFPGTVSSYKGGLYTDLGLGLRMKLVKKVNMVFSLGYGSKSAKNTQVRTICGIVHPCYEEVNKRNYHYRTVHLKVGLEF